MNVVLVSDRPQLALSEEPGEWHRPQTLLHREGIMRLANAKDEIVPLNDMRVQRNRAYLIIVLLSRVMTRLGAFVQFMPGKEGLVHISQLDHKRVEKAEDVVKEGDEFDVKVLEIDSQGRVNLSRKALIPRPEGMPDEPEGLPSQRGGGGYDRGGRGGYDRGRPPRRD